MGRTDRRVEQMREQNGKIMRGHEKVDKTNSEQMRMKGKQTEEKGRQEEEKNEKSGKLSLQVENIENMNDNFFFLK